ncbi:MAG: tRNA (guanine(26)-N(2))-dimethyltransferase [Candidatus Thermoplasmatota archaeon]
MKFNYIEIKEGNTKIFVPSSNYRKGPGSSKLPVFYNPTMEFARDVTVMVLDEFLKEGKEIVDALAGTGITGIRIANEIKKDLQITLNDRNILAYKLMKKNIKCNDVKNVIAKNEDFHILLSKNFYDVVIVDPFGSFVPYIDSAIRALKRNGMLILTATDAPPLCGISKQACMRRYGSIPMKNEFMHEIGIRILLYFCIREAAKHDLALMPLLSYSCDHYFKLFLKIEKGAEKANELIQKFGYYKSAGPLWLGKLHDASFIKKLVPKEYFGTKKRIEKYLGLWKEEVEFQPFFYRIDKLCKKLRVTVPKFDKFIENLRSCGYRASRTHFSPFGFKTDASIEVIEKLLSSGQIPI